MNLNIVSLCSLLFVLEEIYFNLASKVMEGRIFYEIFVSAITDNNGFYNLCMQPGKYIIKTFYLSINKYYNNVNGMALV